MSDFDLFQQRLKEFESLIWFAARKYTLEGVFSTEDLYQEGLIILDSMFRKYSDDICESDIDFSKLFKTELWHGLSNILQYHKRQKRDFRKNVSIDRNTWQNNPKRRDGTRSRNLFDAQPHFEVEALVVDQYEVDDLSENKNNVEDLIVNLLQRLDDDEKAVFAELLNPSTWDDIEDKFKTNVEGDEYWRMPSHPPQHAIANTLGWSHTYYKRTLSRVRQTVKQLGEEQGLDLIASVNLMKRKGRCRA